MEISMLLLVVVVYCDSNVFNCFLAEDSALDVLILTITDCLLFAFAFVFVFGIFSHLLLLFTFYTVQHLHLIFNKS